MKLRCSARKGARQLALLLEHALQAALRAGSGRWEAWQYRRRNFEPEEFRGRTCHCSPRLPLHFVHSEAVRESCDFVVDFGSNVRARGRPSLNPDLLAPAIARLGRGATIHVKADLLDRFVSVLLPRLREPVVLVTGDSDAGGVDRHRALLEHPTIGHWFAQNCDWPGRHPKLSRLPIGLDNPVFTKLEKRLGFAVTMAMGRTPFDATFSRNDLGNQAILQSVRAMLPPLQSRPMRALCTFHQNQKIVAPDLSGLPDRLRAWQILSTNQCCHFVPRRIPQRECWTLHGTFAFEISPHGNGLDCFRTWEALALGTIPIVRRSPLDPLYEDERLPVVIVNDWDEVTPANLARWHERHGTAFNADLEQKLTAEYWRSKISRAAGRVAAAVCGAEMAPRVSALGSQN